MPILSGSSATEGDLNPQAIMVWRTGALGDTLLTIPALYRLRAAYPQATLTFVGTLPHAALLVQPYGPATHVYNAGNGEWAGLFELGTSPSAELADRLTGIDSAVVWSAQAELIAQGLLAHHIHPLVVAPALPRQAISVAEYLVTTLQHLPHHDPANPPSGCARLLLPRGSGQYLPDLPAQPYVVLHPGGGGRHKRWPLASFVTLAAQLSAAGYAIVWTLGPADDDERAALTASGSNRAIWDCRPLTDLVWLLHTSSLTIAGDTGVAHLAAAVACPTLILFGPTDPQVWAPRCPWVTTLRPPQVCGLCVPQPASQPDLQAGNVARAASRGTCLATVTVTEVQQRAITMLGR